MVTEVYSHIIDENRRRNATLLEDSFYNRKNLNPQIHDTEKRTMMEVPEGVDAELLAKSSQQSGNGCVADIISKINARGNIIRIKADR